MIESKNSSQFLLATRQKVLPSQQMAGKPVSFYSSAHLCCHESLSGGGGGGGKGWKVMAGNVHKLTNDKRVSVYY